MGVHGLWKLLEPAGKPVPLESLENKVLAVDVSIWLYQLTKGFQTSGGGIVSNAHILGLFNRICKLLYYRIKPVFIFDGGVPLLKKETIEARKRQKLKAKDISEKLRERLLDNLLKQKAVRNLLGSENSLSSSRNDENDMFALPPLPEPEEDETMDSEEEDESTEMNSAKIDSFCNYQYGKDLHSVDITSEQFKSLPPEIRHDILSELQETRKQSSWARIHEMPDESTDFSKFQMERLVKRRNVQRSLDLAAKEMGGRMMTIGELEEVFREQGIVTDSLPGRRIAGDNITRYVYVTGAKTDKNKFTDEKINENVEVNELDPELASCSKEIKIERQPTVKVEIDESEFRKNVYAIDQCVFVNSSSSDEELENDENYERNYAKKLSLEEKMSQEEILRLIKEQNSTSNEKYEEALPSTSFVTKRPYSDHSDVEDDPDVVVVPGSSVWNSPSFSQQSAKHSPSISYVTPSVTSSNETKDFAKSMTKLDKLINAVKSQDSDLFSCSLSPSENKDDIESVKLLSETDSEDGFVEVTEENSRSQYFCESKNQTIEISINPTKIEDDFFADVFKTAPSDKLERTEIRFEEIPKKKPTTSEITKEPVQMSFKTLDHESPAKHSEISAEVSLSDTIEMSEGEPNVENGKYPSLIKKVDSEIETQLNRQENEETAQKMPIIDLKTKERIREIAEIFNRVRKENENRGKSEEKIDNNDSAPKVQYENLAEVEKVLNTEQAELLSEKGKQERLGSTITQQMIIEAQELLQLFGLPYLVAPMEAEAQCAFLDQISLTEGTITDDSDIWLFGGQKVYKNFFDNRKYVLQFRNVDIEHFFKLSREQLIQMAMLVGSDYTVGVEGVGPVTAIEILAYFSDKSNKPESEADIAETLRKFKLWVQNNRDGTSVLSKKVKNVRLSDGFPNVSVIEAYLYPTVNESKEGFSWAPPDLDRIRQYMKTKFGWKTTRIDEILLPVMKRLADRNKQSTLDAFFKARPYYSVDTSNMSKRVIEAINIMKNKVDVNESQLPEKNSRKSRKTSSNRSTEPKRNTRKSNLPSRPGTSGRSKKGLIASTILTSPLKLNVPGREIIPQKEKDRLEAAKRRMEAIKILRSKQRNQNKLKRRKVLQPKADSSYLSESSSGDDED